MSQLRLAMCIYLAALLAQFSISRHLPTMVATLYDVLRVEACASQLELRAAYKRRVLEVHPDKGGTVEACQQVMAAFERLGDSENRKAYDADLAAKTMKRQRQEYAHSSPEFTQAAGAGAGAGRGPGAKRKTGGEKGSFSGCGKQARQKSPCKHVFAKRQPSKTTNREEEHFAERASNHSHHSHKAPSSKSMSFAAAPSRKVGARGVSAPERPSCASEGPAHAPQMQRYEMPPSAHAMQSAERGGRTRRQGGRRSRRPGRSRSRSRSRSRTRRRRRRRRRWRRRRSEPGREQRLHTPSSTHSTANEKA